MRVSFRLETRGEDPHTLRSRTRSASRGKTRLELRGENRLASHLSDQVELSGKSRLAPRGRALAATRIVSIALACALASIETACRPEPSDRARITTKDRALAHDDLELVHFVRSDRPLCRAMAEGTFCSPRVVVLLASIRRRVVETSGRETSAARSPHERDLIARGVVATVLYLDGVPCARQVGFAGPERYYAFLDGALRAVPELRMLRADRALRATDALGAEHGRADPGCVKAPIERDQAARVRQRELEHECGLDIDVSELESWHGRVSDELRPRIARLLVQAALDRGDIATASSWIDRCDDAVLAATLAFARREPSRALALLERKRDSRHDGLDAFLLEARCLHDLDRTTEARARIEALPAAERDDRRVRDLVAHLDAPGHRHDIAIPNETDGGASIDVDPEKSTCK
ncbi:MAG: tetratricopeptide repeat protein [Planctomycetes bacterium]|nr:tetratricopeptide repeat protein [Planctomycetota bacterium]